MGGVITLACCGRGEPEPAGTPIAQLTDDLFPLPAKHTLAREEQEQKKWIHLSNVKLPACHTKVAFVITLYGSPRLPFVFPFLLA